MNTQTYICSSIYICLSFKNAYTHRGDTHTHTHALEQREREREKYTIQFYVNGSAMSHDDVLVDRWLMSFSTSCNFFSNFCFSFFLPKRSEWKKEKRQKTSTNLNQNFQHCLDRMMTYENQLQRENSSETWPWRDDRRERTIQFRLLVGAGWTGGWGSITSFLESRSPWKESAGFHPVYLRCCWRVFVFRCRLCWWFGFGFCVRIFTTTTATSRASATRWRRDLSIDGFLGRSASTRRCFTGRRS